jgi:hypothetical protein
MLVNVQMTREKAISGVLSALPSNTHASARRRIHERLSLAAARVFPVP